MSVVANSVPEGASPPPEPPPRDYTDMTIDFREEKKDSSCGEDGDVKIRARIEACRQGMMQLDALRSKHIKLMQEMRGRLPTIPGCADVQARIKRSAAINDRSSLQSVDSGVSSLEQAVPSTRCSSPSISHRSSLSCDSGCSSVYSNEMSTRPMPYSMYRKISIEQKEIVPEPVDNTPPIPIVATTIASTTSLRSDRIARAWRRQQQRPRSMFDHSPEQSPRRDSMIDTTSFMQITPPPVHRKMGVVGHPPRSPLTPIRLSVNASPQSNRPLRSAQRPDIVKVATVESADMVFRASRVFVDRSPPQDRRQRTTVRSPRADKRTRPKSMFEHTDEPLYATPVRAMNRDFRAAPVHTPVVVRRTAFVPVVPSRFSSGTTAEQLRTPKGRPVEKNWHESEGL
ncbi:hypothetical protein Q1695_008402 [Nippostrongylus brasiliensis]|nr:hypothetical protein Q1695_008402 [Nippostrongylus brasiliensis]